MGHGLVALSGASAVVSSGTTTQNTAFLYPFTIEVGSLATKLFIMNGATVNGNTDVGIYDGEFQKIVSSGATAQAGTNTLQAFDITDTWLSPGKYYMATSSSSTTSTFFRLQLSDEMSYGAAPIYTMASAHPLPTSITPVTTNAAPNVFLMGVLFGESLL